MWSPVWPNGLDAYGSFPGQPYTDGTEYILAAYGDAWVLTLATLEAYIGYGSGAASPIYSSVYAENFGTMAARFVNVETETAANTAALAAPNPAGRMAGGVLAISTSTQTVIDNMGETFTTGGVTYLGNALYAPVTGTYRASGVVHWPSNSNVGLWQAALVVNGIYGYLDCTGEWTGSAGAEWSTSFSDLVQVTAGDTFAIGAFQSIGGPADLSASQLSIDLVSKS